jgi:hypothetical protein
MSSLGFSWLKGGRKSRSKKSKRNRARLARSRRRGYRGGSGDGFRNSSATANESMTTRRV